MRNKEQPPVDQETQDMIDAVEAGEPFETWSTGSGEPKNKAGEKRNHLA